MLMMKNDISLIKNKINTAEVLFFDLDGTLIDTEPLYYRFWKEASKYYGYELSHEEALLMRSRDKQSAIDFLNIVSNGLLDYYKVKEKRIELMDEYLKDHPIRMKEDAYSLLKKLKKEGKKIFIVTANTVEKAERIIKEVGFLYLLDGIISAKDVKRGKPFPDVFLFASKYVNKNPEEIIVFEDSPNGLMSSHSAGCFTIMVEDMSNYDPSMDYVDAYIHNFHEIL